MSVAHQIDLEEALAAMTEERDHYKRELGLARDADMEARVGVRLGLTKREAAILLTLHRRAGRTVTKSALMDALYAGMDEPALKIIDVFVCKVRKKLADGGHEGDVIETIWGRGYQITAAGVALVDSAMMVAQ